MKLIIIWSNGDKYVEKNISTEAGRKLLQILCSEDWGAQRWGNSESQVLNLKYAREIRLEK